MKKQWFWLVPLLLLLAGIVAPRLNWDGLWYDEIFSVMNSRGAHYGPPTIEGIWTQVTVNDPHQALGYPYLLAGWGLVVGWSEFALRAFSLLAAALAVAITYQLGKRLVSSQLGLFAALILVISTYFINYAHELRSFTFVALAAASLLWSYHKLLFSKKPSIPLQITFVLSGTALLWSHYYTAILLVSIGLYHLIFVSKDKHWRHIVGLALIIGLLFVPEIPSFIKGYTNFSPEDVELKPLSAWEVIVALVYYIGNNAALLTVPALIAGLVYAWKAVQLRMLLIICIFSIIILLISNEFLGILEPTRLRYVIFLWPLFAIWVAAGLVCLSKLFPPHTGKIALVLALIWLANGLYANHQPDFNEMIAGDVVPRMRLMSNELAAEGSNADLLVFYNGTNREAWFMQLGLEYSIIGLVPNRIFSSSIFHEEDESTRLGALQQIDNTQRVWYGVNRTLVINELHEQFLALIEEEFIHCGNLVDEADISLDLYARSEVFCPTDTRAAQFGSSVTLEAFAQSLNDGQLQLNLNWQLSSSTPADTYSLGIYIMPHGVTQVDAQSDTGFANDDHVLMSLIIDISALPTGEYDIWLAVYNWQTLERLLLETGENAWLLGSFSKE
jgi:hypothetical protein